MNDMLTIPAMPANKVNVTQQGIEFKSEISYDEWMELGTKVVSINRTSQFMLGDWINYGAKQKVWGEKYDEALKATGFDYQHLADCARVSKVVHFTERSVKLSWAHHRVVARLKTAEERIKWLKECEDAKENGTPISCRRLAKSILMGRVAQPSEMVLDPADRGVVTYLVFINRFAMWWRMQRKNVETKADVGHLKAMITDFKRLEDILDEIIDVLRQKLSEKE